MCTAATQPSAELAPAYELLALLFGGRSCGQFGILAQLSVFKGACVVTGPPSLSSGRGELGKLVTCDLSRGQDCLMPVWARHSPCPVACWYTCSVQEVVDQEWVSQIKASYVPVQVGAPDGCAADVLAPAYLSCVCHAARE